MCKKNLFFCHKLHFFTVATRIKVLSKYNKKMATAEEFACFLYILSIPLVQGSIPINYGIVTGS